MRELTVETVVAAVAASSGIVEESACDLSSGIDIGGTNLVVGCVAEDGSALHALRERADPARGGRGRRGGPAGRPGPAGDRRDQAGEIPGARDRRRRASARPGPLDTKSGIVLLTPNLGWVNLPLRQIIHDRLGLPRRWTTTPTAPCSASGGWARPGEPGTRSASPSAPASAAGSSSTGELYHGASDVRRRDRAHDHRHRRPPLQVRQLRLPRGLRLGPGHRACAPWRRSRPAP